MYSTKSDLSANEAKVDFQALLETAGTAFRLSREQCHRYIEKLYDWNLTNTSRGLTASYLAEEAKKLAVAAEIYSVLVEAATSDRDITIINRNSQNGKE